MLNEHVFQVILTLAEELHFGRTATILHVSQPALSATVKNLESELGVRLFRRTSRHVELTKAGEIFVAEARRLFEDLERAIALVRGSSSDNMRPLRIGYPSSINLRWLCSLISDARRDVPLAVDLQFVSSEGADLADQLTKGTLDAAFSVGALRHQDLQCVPLFREPFEVAVRSQHRLAQYAILRFDFLEDEPVVWLRRDLNPMLYDNFMASCSSQGYHPNMVQEVRTFYEGLEFAREGLGITFLPSFMETGDLDQSVVFARLPEGSLHMEYTLAFRRDGVSEGVGRFVRFVQEHVPGKN